MKFEDLLKGRDLAELTDEEIQEIVEQLTPEEAARAPRAIRKTSPKRRRAKAEEMVNALIAKGLAEAQDDNP